MSPFSDFVRFSYNMTFMITISTQAFLNSYFGHSILTASDELSNAAYSSKWYLMSRNFRKDLVILMERLKIKSELMAGKLFSIDLTLFGQVISDVLFMTLKAFYIFFIQDYELCLSIIFNFERWQFLKNIFLYTILQVVYVIIVC